MSQKPKDKITMADLRTRLGDIFTLMRLFGDRFKITHNGKQAAALIPTTTGEIDDERYVVDKKGMVTRNGVPSELPVGLYSLHKKGGY